MNAYSVADIQEAMRLMTPAERREFERLVGSVETPIWEPLPGPQTMAFESRADIIGYGGAAGGGKTDLACGKALTGHHRKIMILRREATQLTGIIDRLTELRKGRDGYNGQEKIWRLHDRQIEFGSVPNPGDGVKYQGRPRDFLVLDETSNFLEADVRFLLGWLRTVDPTIHPQALFAFNPPTTAEGRWIVDFFAPWLDKKHPNPAQPGELRWFATINGKDVEVDSGEPFEHDGEIIKPMSRTFIPSRIADNPYLMGTGYMATLQSLPEPLRSQMLYGDFHAGMGDDPWQVIPTAWVEAAMARWQPQERLPEMMGMGVDVARGGQDSTTIARRYKDWWFNRTLEFPGRETPDGPSVAGLVIANQRDQAPIHLDVIGVGASPYDFLVTAKQQVLGINVAEKALGTDRSGKLRFVNLRSELWWKFRELLDPQSNLAVALPPERELLVELCAPRWELRGPIIYVESREDIVKRIGRSPDRASAYILASIETPKIAQISRLREEAAGRVLDQRGMGYAGRKGEYDPYSNYG